MSKYWWWWWNSYQNLCTCWYHNCYYCVRFWDSSQRREVNAFCAMQTREQKRIEEIHNAGGVPEEWAQGLEWQPPWCGVFVQK